MYSTDTGFLWQCPVRRLCPYFEPWERLCDDLPQLLRDKKLRHEVKRLPLLEVIDARLPTEAHWHKSLYSNVLHNARVLVDGRRRRIVLLYSQEPNGAFLQCGNSFRHATNFHVPVFYLVQLGSSRRARRVHRRQHLLHCVFYRYSCRGLVLYIRFTGSQRLPLLRL